MFALDTNAFIHAMKGKGGVPARLAATSPSELAVPAVVIYELEYGTLKSAHPAKRRNELQRLLEFFQILPFDQQTASAAASLRLNLEMMGIQIGPLDTLIAATVLANGCVLVSHNTAEFSRVPGLRIEDWF